MPLTEIYLRLSSHFTPHLEQKPQHPTLGKSKNPGLTFKIPGYELLKVRTEDS